MSTSVFAKLVRPRDPIEQKEAQEKRAALKELIKQKKLELNPVVMKDNFKLLRACEIGDLKQIRKLFKVGSNPNIISINNLTPLHKAARSNHAMAVKELIKAKSDLNIQGVNGWTSLHIAAKRGFFEVVKILINNNANLNIQGDFGDTALHFAAKNGHFDIVKAILEAGALQINNSFNETPEQLAIINNYPEIADLCKDFNIASIDRICVVKGS